MVEWDSPEAVDKVNSAMRAWRQGDVIRPAKFVHLADLSRPGTPISAAAAERGRTGAMAIVAAEPDGLVVISQTCDIVAKSPIDAPYVSAGVLVRLDGDRAAAARAGERPRYVHIPQLGLEWFVDLDQIVSVEKAALVGVSPERGLEGSHEESRFGAAVGRKFSRFAFPDDLHESLRSLQERFKSRHTRPNSAEGDALRQVTQIRVSTDGDWSSDSLNVHLVFLVPPGTLPPVEADDDFAEPTFELQQWLDAKARAAADIAERLRASTTLGDRTVLWSRLADAWAGMAATPCGVVTRVTAEVLGADEYSVARYWSSERLDLDYLSGPSSPG